MTADSFSTTSDFSGYLQAIGVDDRYRDGRELYTETEVLILLEAETVARKPPEADGSHESEPTQPKVEWFPVLEGLRKYALGGGCGAKLGNQNVGQEDMNGQTT